MTVFVAAPPLRARAAGSRWATARRRLATSTAVAACLLSAITAVALASMAYSERGIGNPLSIGLGFLLSCTAAVMLVWRYRWPAVVFGLAAAAPLLGITDALAVLVALVGVVRVQRPRWAATATGLATAAVGVSLTWDARRGGVGDDSLLLAWRGVRPPTPFEVPVGVAWLVALVLVALAAALGVLLRTTSALAVAERTTARVASESSSLREEVVRAEERARLARDIHDGLSTLLTRISLHSGVLQVRAYDGLPERERDEVVGTAEVIWRTAREAGGALADAVGVLRAPGAPPAAGVDQLPALARQFRTDGLRATLVLDVADGLADAVSTQVHRVVTEALGNAQRYAGEPRAVVVVTADPVRGVDVSVRSPLPRRPPTSSGTGTGLAGLGESVRACGGRLGAGPRGDEFVVEAWLPWPAGRSRESRDPVGGPR